MAMQRQRSHEPPPPYTNEVESLKLPLISSPEQRTASTTQSPSPRSLPILEPTPNLVGSPKPFDSPSHSSGRLDRDSLTLPQLQPSLNTPGSQPRQLPPLASHSYGTISSPTEAVSVMSLNDSAAIRREKSASLEDPDDRMAAEALCGLGKVEPPRLVSGYDTPLKYYQGIEHTRPGASHDDQEPLLSLLTSSHPWLGGTINGSISAYSSTKSYSPRFIQYGADFVERTFGSPVANTVGSVSKRTGMEGSLRRYLGARRPSELDQSDRRGLSQDASFKKRKLDLDFPEPMDLELAHTAWSPRRSSTRSSIDSLPPYDENRSPEYEDAKPGPSSSLGTSQQLTMRPSHNRSWSTQLMISTSGLGAALNDASLKSLRNCLIVLKSANGHVRRLMDALKSILQQREESPQGVEEAGNVAMHDADQHRPATLTSQIKHLNSEIWNTLKTVVNKVSKYTGGALPENASAVVRWQLMSVPRRWQRAVSQSAQPPPQTSANGSPDPTDEEVVVVSSAHHMMAFAIEGLDMMDQVGGVIDSTIVSAEKWLDSMGRKRNQEAVAASSSAESQQQQTPQEQSSIQQQHHHENEHERIDDANMS